MVIVGQSDFPEGLWVSLHNKKGYGQFFPSNEAQTDLRSFSDVGDLKRLR